MNYDLFGYAFAIVFFILIPVIFWYVEKTATRFENGEQERT